MNNSNANTNAIKNNSNIFATESANKNAIYVTGINHVYTEDVFYRLCEHEHDPELTKPFVVSSESYIVKRKMKKAGVIA